MKNIVCKIQKDAEGHDHLIMDVDLTKSFGPSSSGKTTIIASSEGNKPIAEGSDVYMGVNIYKKGVKQ